MSEGNPLPPLHAGVTEDTGRRGGEQWSGQAGWLTTEFRAGTG